MAKTVLITGAAGFIGYHLGKRLLETTDARVVGFDNLNAYYDVSLKRDRLRALEAFGERFVFCKGDLAHPDAIEAVFAQYQPELVVNLAAQAGVRYSIENPRAYMESNVMGFFNLLESIRKYPVAHLIYASSSSVYGNQEKTPFAVSDPVDHPISLYAATKKCDELIAYSYAHLYGIPCTGVRFFTVYGPLGRPDMAYFKFANKICAGETIDVYNNGDLLRDFTYIDDIVTGLVAMLRRAPDPDENGVRCRVYNLGNSAPVPLMTFIETLEHALGKQAKKRFLPMQPGDVYQTYADVADTQRVFGFAPCTPIAEGLDHFAQWYRAYYGVK